MDQFPEHFNLDAVHDCPHEETLELCLRDLKDMEELNNESASSIPSTARDVRLRVMQSVVEGMGGGRVEVDLNSEEVDVVVDEIKALGFEVTERITPFFEGHAGTVVRRTLLIENYPGASMNFVAQQDPGHSEGIVNGFAFGGLMSANAFGTIGRH